MTTPAFTDEELWAMHTFCCWFRDIVRAGGTPTAEECAQFMRYQRITFREGVANG